MGAKFSRNSNCDLVPLLKYSVNILGNIFCSFFPLTLRILHTTLPKYFIATNVAVFNDFGR